MKKRILATLLSICLLVGLLPTAVFADSVIGTVTGGTWGGIDWTFEVTDANGNGKLTIAPTTKDPDELEFRPESENAGNPVRYKVGELRQGILYVKKSGKWSAEDYYSPWNPAKVIDIEIQEGVTDIGTFGVQNLACTGELVIPASVKHIGWEAFMGGKFTKLTFAERGADSEPLCIAQGAFKKLAIQTVELPEGLKCIHAWAFVGCKLESVYIPSTVTEMAGQKHVYDYPPGADNTSSAIFAGNPSLKTVTFANEAVRNKFMYASTIGTTAKDLPSTPTVTAFTGLTVYTNLQAALNAATEDSDTVTLIENTSVSSGKSITIPEGVTLVIPADKTLTNAGCLINLGMIDGSGTFDNTSTYAETGSNISNTVIQTGSGRKTTAYTITYDLGGGTLESENPIAYCAASPDFTLQNPTRPGYTFKGWSGTGLGESENLTVTISSGSTGNRSYTANWVGNEYAVTLETDGGTIRSGNVSSYVCGVGADLPTNVTKDGYSFAGWYNNPEYSGTRVTKITDTDLGDKVFYAKWNKAQIVVILSYPPVIADCPNGSLAVSPANPTVGSTVTVTATPDEGFAAESVTVTAKNGESIAVTANADGTYSFVQPKGSVTVSASFAKIETSDPFDAFVDLNKDAWYRDGVRFAIESGLMVGIAEDQFAPAATASRAMIVTTLWRLAGEPETASDAAFADVDYKAWYGEAIRWAADIGIVEGYGSNLFGTTDDITREQLAVFLYRYERYMSEDSGETQTFDLDFADTESVSPWAQEALSWMVENGIMEGKDGNRLDPRGTATRAEIATVLFRYVTLKTQK